MLVPMILPAVIGGLSAAGSLYGAIKGSKNAEKAQKAQMAMHQDQMGLARDQMGFAQGHYDFGQDQYLQYQARFDPILDAMQSEALANRSPDYGLISADAAQAFGSQREAGQRQMQRYGINPGDGMWGANNRQAQLGQAGAEVMAMQNARRNAGNQRYSQLANLYGVGAGMMSGAASMMGQGVSASSSAANMGINAAGQAAGAYGQQAAQAGQQSSNNWASFGQGLAGLAGSFGGGGSSGPLGPNGSFASPGMPSMDLPGGPGMPPIRINGGG